MRKLLSRGLRLCYRRDKWNMFIRLFETSGQMETYYFVRRFVFKINESIVS